MRSSFPTRGSGLLLAVLLALSTLGLVAAPARAQADLSSGPTTLLISYRTTAANRPAFRHYLVDTMAPRLRAMEKAGRIAGFRILFSWYRQPQVWDALLVLRFPGFEAVANWNALEHDQPGGLDAAGLALADPVATYNCDLEWSHDPDGVRDGEVYYLIPYQYREAGEYRAYVKGYVVPQFEGWMKAGALDGYGLLMNRYSVGTPWDSLFILRYRDMDAFGRRQTVLDAVRDTLRTDPEWKAWSDKKAGIRTESENSIAELIAH